MTTQPYSFRRSPFRAAFTLVELLVVISIIALMLGVMTPVYNKVMGDILRKKVRATLASLESGCKRYKADLCGNGNYPPGGAENLVKYLTGRGMPVMGTEAPPGGGFQMIRGGRVYGPYVELDPKSILLGSYAIKDVYDNQIAYYAKDSTGTFVGSVGIADPATYSRNTVDMFCSSPGPNGTYGTSALGADYDGDDIVTFVSEE